MPHKEDKSVKAIRNGQNLSLYQAASPDSTDSVNSEKDVSPTNSSDSLVVVDLNQCALLKKEILKEEPVIKEKEVESDQSRGCGCFWGRKR